MKEIRYKVSSEVSFESGDKIETKIILRPASMPYTEDNYKKALDDAYQGDVTVVDIPDPRPLSEIQSARQEENKAALAAWLAEHPLTWTDGKQYGVEEQDQNEMALNLMQYQINKDTGTAVLEWHAQKEECRTFDEVEYVALSKAITAYVYPYRRYQEKIKAAIYAAQTAEDVEAITIDYAAVVL
jgi:hypothetical protein